MLKYFMVGASVAALASTAAVADPAASETAAAEGAATQYTAEVIALKPPITPLEVTTRADSQTLAEIEFAIADANADGFIDESEFAAYAKMATEENAAKGFKPERATPLEKAFSSLAKGDKKISKPELTEARGKSFDAADANRDTMLDALEQQKFASLVAVKPPAETKTQ